MATFLYILQSQTSGKYYVGSGRSWEFASLLEAGRELEIKRWKSARRYHGRGEMGDGAETGKLVMSRLRAQFAE
jgi:hypothetical protein